MSQNIKKETNAGSHHHPSTIQDHSTTPPQNKKLEAIRQALPNWPIVRRRDLVLGHNLLVNPIVPKNPPNLIPGQEFFTKFRPRTKTTYVHFFGVSGKNTHMGLNLTKITCLENEMNIILNFVLLQSDSNLKYLKIALMRPS